MSEDRPPVALREIRRRVKAGHLAMGISQVEWILDARQEYGDEWAIGAFAEVIGKWKDLLDELEEQRPKRTQTYARRFDSLPVTTAPVQEALL